MSFILGLAQTLAQGCGGCGRRIVAGHGPSRAAPELGLANSPAADMPRSPPAHAPHAAPVPATRPPRPSPARCLGLPDADASGTWAKSCPCGINVQHARRDACLNFHPPPQAQGPQAPTPPSPTLSRATRLPSFPARCEQNGNPSEMEPISGYLSLFFSWGLHKPNLGPRPIHSLL